LLKWKEKGRKQRKKHRRKKGRKEKRIGGRRGRINEWMRKCKFTQCSYIES
jgi:hypothetical protein